MNRFKLCSGGLAASLMVLVAASAAAQAPGETAQLVARLGEWGAVGVGQSSWGPAVYGIVGEEAASRTLAERARGVLEQAGSGVVYEGGFSAAGAQVWREDAPVSG